MNTKIKDRDPFLHFTLGHPSGLTYLYNLYRKPLIQSGLHILPDYFAVENIVQDAFLKAWLYRQRLTSPLHAYRFMRLNTRWACYHHYHQPEHKYIMYADQIEQYANPIETTIIEEDQQVHPREAMLQSINEVLPFLPVKRRTLVELRFKQGYSYQQIAKRLVASPQAISYEVQQSLTSLKQMLHTSL